LERACIIAADAGPNGQVSSNIRKRIEPKLRCDLEIGSRNILLLINKIDALQS
jgi:hypothetical protein